MSKSTQINKRLIAKIPTPGNDVTTLGVNSVGTNNLQDGSVTENKLDPSISLRGAFGAGFQNFVDTQNILVATTSTGAPAAGSFYSTILNRKSIVDLSQDLKARMGIERIATQYAVQLQDEFGTNGEPVYSLLNDVKGLVRFVGNWSSVNNASGIGVFTNTVNDYVEITFYGTGLNLLAYTDSNNSDYRVSVDGGTEGSNIFPTGKSAILANRNSTINAIVPAVSGLTLGVHTVKIRLASIALSMCGFEVLNQSSTIKLNPGSSYVSGKKLTLSSQQSLAYDSSFESGTLGTRGGRVLIYQKADGSIAKAVNPGGSQLNLSSANHSNEEVIRTYSHREFGAGRSDDFSYNSAAVARAFTLDDGTTSLAATSDIIFQPTVPEGIFNNSVSGFITFTFVGTGLDVLNKSLGTVAYTLNIAVDGTNIGTGLTGASLGTSGNWLKIVSGLPYGTHSVRFTVTGNTGFAFIIAGFKTYGPKKPSLPSGAIELADYNLMANFVANSTAGTDTISTGILRKQSLREFTYVNGTGGSADWAVAFNAGNGALYGQLFTDRLNASSSYTFFGTGFDFRFDAGNNRSANISVTLNGSAATVGNFPSLVSSVYGTGVAFSSGTLDMLDASGQSGSGLVISGLPLGTYTVKFNNNSAGAFIIANSIDIITPIHSTSSNSYANIQNALPIGSCGISDNRKITPVKEIIGSKKPWSQAIGVVSSPSTTSTVFIPMPDMSIDIETTGGDLDINYSILGLLNTTSVNLWLKIYVDGVPVGADRAMVSAVANLGATVSDTIMVPVSPGKHQVVLYWRVDSATGTTYSISRTLKVREN